jgi:sialate O-acetylesterase
MINITLLSFLFLVSVVYADFVYADGIALSNVFGDHMVIQRDTKVPVWGTGSPGGKVTVQFAGQSKTAVVEATGRWRLDIGPYSASSEPRDILVNSGDNTLRITDVLVGEVWLASGQSNMGSPVNSLTDAADVLKKAQDQELRFFMVTRKTASEPQSDLKGKWEISSPEAAKNFSAVAYFFASEIRKNQKCPVAVLQAPWGGTSIETWISLEGLKMNPPEAKMLQQWDKAVEQYLKIKENPQFVADYEKDLKLWQLEVAPAYNAAMKEYNKAISEGKPVNKRPQPSRPEPNNPDPMGMPSPSRRPGTPTVNFNGMIAPLVPFAIRGVIWYQGENNGSAGLEYRTLMPRLIEDWRNQWKQPGAAKNFPFLYVQLPSCGIDSEPVAEKGWPFLREAQLMALRVTKTGMAVTIDIGDPKNVHPADKIDVGQRLALIARKVAYGENIVASGPIYKGFVVKQGGKVEIRFSETGSGLTIGQSPWYAPGVEPFPKDKLIGFFIAGNDKKWVEANARIEGQNVIVSSPEVPVPVAVRYGWASSPRCNLYNMEGLPASPFRTDVE